jgi:putative ABC transport system substrate-binding protein
MIRRRVLLISLAGVITAPLAAAAQPAKKIARIGFLSPSSLSDPRTRSFVEAFRQGLRDLGWVEGQNVTIEYRWAEERTERLAELAGDLARLNIDVLVATSPAIQAAKRATRTIPIVMTNAGDAIATGFVVSLARPEANITGLSMMGGELVAKQLQILKEVVPTLSRVAVLSNPTNSSNPPQLRYALDAAQILGVRLHPVEARGPGEIDGAFAEMTKERTGAVILLLDSMLVANRHTSLSWQRRAACPPSTA